VGAKKMDFLYSNKFCNYIMWRFYHWSSYYYW